MIEQNICMDYIFLPFPRYYGIHVKPQYRQQYSKLLT